MSEPDDRPLPWAEMLLSLPLIAVVAYGLGATDFPWKPIVFFYWLPGALIGFWAARSRGFRPMLGVLAGMLICFPFCLLLFLADRRKPASATRQTAEPHASAETPLEAAGPVQPEPRKGLAKASAFFGISGFACWGLCGVAPALGLVLGIIALTLTCRAPDRYGGRGLAATGIVTSLGVAWFLLTGPIPSPTSDMLRWRYRTDGERAVVQALRTNVGRTVAVEGGRPEPPPELSRVSGWQLVFHPGPDQQFAFVAIPIERRFWKRLDEVWWRAPRAFCADDTGRVCYVEGGLAPALVEGRCPPFDECLDHR